MSGLPCFYRSNNRNSSYIPPKSERQTLVSFVQPLPFSPSLAFPSPSASSSPPSSLAHEFTDVVPARSLLQPPHLLRQFVRSLVAVVVLDLDLVAEEADDYAGEKSLLAGPEDRDAGSEGEGRRSGRRRAAVVAIFVLLEAAVLLALVGTPVTLEPLHVDIVDASLVAEWNMVLSTAT